LKTKLLVNESIKVFSRTENLEIVRNFVRKVATKAGFSEDDIHKIILAVDEACTNIIKHAYKYSPAGEIFITAKADSSKLLLLIKDRGESFEPTKIPAPDIKELVKNKRVGGLGIFLMKQLMDVVEYGASKNQNQLKLIKYLPKTI